MKDENKDKKETNDKQVGFFKFMIEVLKEYIFYKLEQFKQVINII